MIVSRIEGRLRLVTQPDHARVAAEILTLWRADGLPDHPRRAELLFAVREHDNGWQEADAAPRVNPRTGEPYDFLDLPDQLRLELWERACARYANDRPGAAALIIRHALYLHRDRTEQEGWSGPLAALEERLDERLEAAGLERADLECDHRWLRLADAISLRACGVLGDDFADSGTRVQRTDRGLELDPFPLAGATTFTIPCRLIPDRRYTSDTDLTIELASSPWTELEFRLVPAD